MVATAREVHGWRRGMRWVKRGALALLVLVVVVVGGALLLIHTDYGRDKVRGFGNDQLAKLFVGGGTIGHIDGSPFGELVLRDVVINGPDRQPAIRAKAVRVSVGVFDLLKHDIKLEEVIAEDVDIVVKRDPDGSFAMAKLMTPPDPNQPVVKSKWNVDLADIDIVRAHVMIDTGSPDAGIVNLDDVAILGNLHLDNNGTKAGGLRIAATWRERKAPITILAAVRDDAESTQARHLEVSVGGVSMAASNIKIMKATDGAFPHIAGMFVVNAPRDSVAALVPRLQLPGDVAFSLTAGTARGAMIPIALAGHVGASSVKADLQADPDAKHVSGTLTTSEVDLAALTEHRIDATGALAATFDVTQGAAGELPTATATITAHGTYQNIPRTELTGQLASHGQHITGDLAVSGPMQAKLSAAITRAGAAIHLDRAQVVASIADPKAASGGKAPIHGQLAVNLDASGALSPSPDLAVKATVNGKRIRMQDLSVATLAVSIDGTHLPYQPHGKATVTAIDIVRGDMQLGRLELDAQNRSDGKIAVNITSHPKQDPWLIELAALVTPPGKGDTVTIDLGKHRVRAGNRTEWTGDGGRIVIDPRHVALDTFTSKSGDGALAVAGSLDRRNGDLAAKVDVDRFTLAALGARYRGLVTAHVAMTRSHAELAGTADISGTGIALDPTKPPVDVNTKIAIKPGTITVDANVESATLGQAMVALDLATPHDIADVQAWKRAGRSAIKTAKLTATNVDLAQLSTLLAQPVDTTVARLQVLGHLYAMRQPGTETPATAIKPQVGGRLDGELTITATTAKGDFKIQKLRVPQIRGVGRVDAELAIDQSTAQRIVPTVTLKVDQMGTLTARAELALPANVFDLNEWQKLDLKAVHGATLRTTQIAFDPAMLQRFGIESSMRGKANVTVDVSDGLGGVKVTGDITELRGSPVAQPIAAHVEANLDGKVATGKFVITTKQGTVTLLSLDAKLPITLEQLRTDPKSVMVAALDAKLELQQTSAPALLAVFGRDVITDGTLNGKVLVTGTLEHPKLVGHIVAANIKTTPGSYGKPTPVLKELVLDATYNDRGGKLTLVGTEDQGGTLNVDATFDLGHLKAGTATIKAAKFDMKPMLAFAPDPGSAAKGILDANLAIQGFDPRTAQITGELHMRNARLPIAPSVGTVRQANIDVVITAKQIKLAATGKLGKGDIKLDGTIALDGADLTGGEAKLILHKVSPIGAIEPEVNAEVTAKISRQNERWTADVTIGKGFVKINKTSGEALNPIGTPDDLHLSLTKVKPKRVAATGKGPNAPPPPVAPGLVAHVTLEPIKVEADEFRTTVHGKVDVTSDGSTMGVTGTIEASSGDLDLFDRRYRIERAAVMFDGTVDPNLEIRLTHDFPDVTTVTEVRGRLSKPDLVLTADPGLYSQSELLGFLLGGEPGGDPQSASARDKAAQVGSSIVAGQIGGYIKKALPFDIDVIRYEAATATSSAAITVGSWITHTLFFSFSQHMDARPDENSGEGTLEYWFTRRLELELTAGDRNYDGADLLWRKRY